MKTKIIFEFGDPNDMWWAATEYDYLEADITINICSAWRRSKGSIDKCIVFITQTITHEFIHVAIIDETRHWALGEELFVRRMNYERITKKKLEAYKKEYGING